MNFNTSPLAFFPSRAAQSWRAWWHQNKQCIICGNDLIPFYIQNVNEDAPATCELYNPNTDTKVADLNCYPHLLTHTATVDGQSVKIWIYQATQAGVFGYTQAGYYYLKIGSYYSDVFRIGALPSEYVSVSWQFYDDIMTVDGSLLSKYIVYKQIFPVPLWKPEYNIEEEGKTNNGVFFATQQTTKKTCSFESVCNEPQADVMNLVRMADSVQIDACSNGVQRSYNSNQFEVEIKWQTDDTATVKCDFDLFNIVRKYQKSATAPEPLPIPQPPTPPANYYLKGTVSPSVLSIQLDIDGTTQTIQCTNGEFEYGYNTPITTLRTSTQGADEDTGLSNVDKILTLDLSESDLFQSATTVVLNELSNCTTINFGDCVFSSITSVDRMFMNDSQLQSISAPQATFASVTNGENMCKDCVSLVSFSLPLATLKTGCNSMFTGCTDLQTVNMPLSTFEDATHTSSMFALCENLESITMTAATFASVGNMESMFRKAGGLFNYNTNENEFDASVVFPACTAQPIIIDRMFQGSNFLSIDLTTLDLSACTDAAAVFGDSKLRGLTMNGSQFDAMTDTNSMFRGCILRQSTLNVLASATFPNVTNAANMFQFTESATGGSFTLALTAATFASLTNAKNMFNYTNFVTIDIPNATFQNVTDSDNMFANNSELETLNIPNAALTGGANLFTGSNALVTVNVPQSATFNSALSILSPTISPDSLVNVAYWLKDLSGDTAKVIRITSVAKTALQIQTAKWNTFSNLLSTKNWTLYP